MPNLRHIPLSGLALEMGIAPRKRKSFDPQNRRQFFAPEPRQINFPMKDYRWRPKLAADVDRDLQ